ncbi:MAG: hypothetical protein RLZZ234_886 [Candidatus Parcubacteria bacterium]|jgi:hypothetical protein
MRSFLVALAVDDVMLHRTYAILPLHLTVLPRFVTSSMDDHMVCRVVYEASRDIAPLMLKSVRQAKFGVRNETDAHLVKRTPGIMQLHYALLDRLAPHGLRLFRPEYAREGYLPHVSHVGPYTFGVGSEHSADILYTVKVETFDDGTFQGTVIGRSRLL